MVCVFYIGSICECMCLMGGVYVVVEGCFLVRRQKMVFVTGVSCVCRAFMGWCACCVFLVGE